MPLGCKAMLPEVMLWFEFGKCLNLMMHGIALGEKKRIDVCNSKLPLLNINVDASVLSDKYKNLAVLFHEARKLKFIALGTYKMYP